MLTHTWLLEAFLGSGCPIEDRLDLITYNICPDFLPISEAFSSVVTHGAPRFAKIPYRYRKASFIVFHLMVDDISHYGEIAVHPITDFDPHSKGYSYEKGRSLVEPLIDLYHAEGKELDYVRAAYRSHMIIEMTFDLALYLALTETSERLIRLMGESIQFTAEERLAEFSETVGWFYGVNPEVAAEALLLCAEKYTINRIRRFMNLAGRVNLFANKFDLLSSLGKAPPGLEVIMRKGMDLVQDYDDFLDPTLSEIRRVGFDPVY